ncbi:MAG TPA: DUF1576 domain-containing protein [Treponema sp.]|nr:DUF1576 domain-containing protein [Treponema sp.]HRU29886.1 DUF1576 domain-containing protein [Treponema sp.]
MNDRNPLFIILLGIICFFFVLAFLVEPPLDVLYGYYNILTHPGRLISDFSSIGGIGAVLLNVSLMGFLGLLVIQLAGVSLSGPTFAAIMTIIGFSFFGKTPVNTAPIVFGVYIAAKLAGKSFKNYLIIALFGTAFGPITSYVANISGLHPLVAILLGLLLGMIVGVFLPSLAIAMLRLHEGYNLYNVGFSCGFLGLFFASLFTAVGMDLSIQVEWNTTFSLILTAIIPIVSLLLIIAGISVDGIKKSVTGLMAIQKLSGRLPADFTDLVSPGAALLNAGLLGLAGSIYVISIGAVFNGPVIGALFTIIGFGTFGKHLKNVWPVVSGILAATLISGKSPTAPGPLLALLFGTTLAPIAGEFGIVPGIIAGFLHLVLVERTAVWHGGLVLYNNGFSGGLVATFIFAVSEWIKANIKKR